MSRTVLHSTTITFCAAVQLWASSGGVRPSDQLQKYGSRLYATTFTFSARGPF